MSRINLFLLPGLDGTGQLFRPLLANLPVYLTPYVIQYPPDVSLDYPQLIDFVRKRVLTDKPFVILAESFSGPVALELAAKRPENLVALILCATFVTNPTNKLLYWASPLLGDKLFRFTPPEFLVRYFLIGYRSSQDLVHTFINAVKMVSGKVLSFRVKSIFKVNAKDALRACQVPILYLSARGDKVVGERSINEIRAIKPKVEIVTIDGPHFILQSEPVKSVEAIDIFLRSRLKAV